MTKKHIPLVVLLLPVLAFSGSGAALAQHRLKAARSTVPAATDPYSAYAQAGPQRSLDQHGVLPWRSCTYDGGPKSLFWTCRYR